MSTTNHNILYFFCNHCIHIVNTGNRLWKAWMRQEWRGVGGANFPEFGAIFPRFRVIERTTAHFGVIDKRSPRGGRGQGAGTVQFGCKLCGEVDKRVQSSGRLAWCVCRNRCGDFQPLNRDWDGIICWWRTRTIRIPPGFNR
jgi:hypothetical protein